jgi:hypothetical protein
MTNNYGTAQSGQGTSWYYTINGERKGPLMVSSIMQLYSVGIIKNETLVWTQGFSDWRPFSQSGLTHEATMGPPPVVGQAVNNSMVWWLAFMPILGSIIEYLMSDATGIASKSLWFITIGLNVLLCTLDDKNLQKAGYNTKPLGSSWVIPVYLFKRAKFLKQSYSYAIVWCVTFIVLLFA